MSLEALISAYGLPALVAGAFVEEATFVVMAGLLAHQGYFPLTAVLLVSWLAAFLGAQLLFQVSRKKGTQWIDARPKVKLKLERMRGFLARNEMLVILCFRFVYGLHTVAPVSMGISRISVARFAFLNAAGAAIWSVVFSFAGYGFGRILNLLLEDIRHMEKHLLAVIAVVGLAAWLVHKLVQWRKARRGPSAPG